MRRCRLPSHSATPDRRSLGSQSGFVLPVVLVVFLVLTLELGGLIEYAASSIRQVRAQENYLKTYYIAESGAEKAVSAIRLYIAKNGSIPATFGSLTAAPNVGTSYSYPTFSLTSNAASYQTLTVGDYKGLNGNAQTVTITVTANGSSGTPATATVTQALQIQQIPIFQFGIFYQNDLEIGPGQNMTFAGAVHTNSDLYLTADNGRTLTFDSIITAAKSIFHAEKYGGTPSAVLGDVLIKDGSGVNQNMKSADDSWLDSLHADWLLQSQDRWDGRVQSSVHGTQPLSLPLATGTQPHDIIERRSAGDSTQLQSQKLDYKSHLRIIDGTAYDQASNVVELRYCSGGASYNNGCPSGQTVVNPIATPSFYDKRELKTIRATEVDVAKLNGSPAFTSLVSANNGVIVYFSDLRNQGAGTENALRLVNGSTLPTKGVTFASENPVYVKGSYNTVSKQPAGIAADSFNVLSGSWNDANSSLNISNRVASNTTVNTAVITGNTESTAGFYNGGIENIHRMLENWSGKTLTYKGSIIVLHNSQTGTAQWGNSDVYSPPSRNWSFDTDFSNISYAIPGFPSVINLAKASYEHA